MTGPYALSGGQRSPVIQARDDASSGGGNPPPPPLAEHRGLVDELAEPGVAEVEDEGEKAVIAVDRADAQCARRQEVRQAQPAAADHQENMVAEEVEGAAFHRHPERDPEAA